MNKTSTSSVSRVGAANNLAVIAIGAILVLGVLAYSLSQMGGKTTSDVNEKKEKSSTTETSSDLMLFCAAGMRPAAEKAIARYKDEYGIQVQIQYGGSNTLLSQIEVSQTGDLYLSADDIYIKQAQDKGLVKEAIPIASQKPVIIVPAGNPKKIASIDDLLKPDVKVSLGNPESAAIGNITRKLLEKSGHWDKLEAHVRDKGVMKPTVPEVANDVVLGSADAGIIWNSFANLQEKLDSVSIPELDAGKAEVMIGVLSSTQKPTDSLKMARYLASRDRGGEAFAQMGCDAVEDADIWEEHPEINFYCGSVNRRAVEDVIKEFEKREGVTVNTRYDGCGILVGQMRTILGQEQSSGFPDTYMACDRYYLEQVSDLFQDDVNISTTSVVIAVRKDNPKQIETLADLAKEGIRVAVGQPDQCTIGVLSKQLLESENLFEAVSKNVVSQTTSSAMLVPLVSTNSVDAVLAYETDTRASTDEIKSITIESEKAKAVQPFSIAKSSQRKYLSRRLYEAVSRAQKNFESVGFNWLLEQPIPEEGQ